MSEGGTEGKIVHISDVRDAKLRQSDQTPQAKVVANPNVSELSRGAQDRRNPNTWQRAVMGAAAVATAAAAVFGLHKGESNPVEPSQVSGVAMNVKPEGNVFGFRDMPETDFQKKAAEDLAKADPGDSRVRRNLIVGKEGANFRNVPVASTDQSANAESIIGKLPPTTVVPVAIEVPGKSLDGSKWFAANVGGKVGFVSSKTLESSSSSLNER